MSIKYFFRLVIPPIAQILYKKVFRSQAKIKRNGWFGNYRNWDVALKESVGYADDVILKSVIESTKKVLSDEAVFERDSVAFTHMEYNWPVLALLSDIAMQQQGKLKVLDYGGATGSSFFQYKKFFGSEIISEWRVVEQAHYVDAAKEFVNHSAISFYKTISDACLSWKPDVILLSSVLPYIENYQDVLVEILEVGSEHLIIDRTTFINDQDRITLQIVPENIYKASYPCRFFNKESLMRLIEKKYNYQMEFKSYCDPEHYNFEDGKTGTWEGIYFKLS